MISLHTIWIINAVFFIVSILTIVAIYLLRAKKVIKSKIDYLNVRSIQQLLAETITAIEKQEDKKLDQVEPFITLQHELHDATTRIVALNEMIRLTHILEGKEVTIIRKLFFALHLNRMVLNLLKSSEPQKKIKGIKLLSGIRFVGFTEHFQQLSQDKNLSVRTEAIIANMHYAEDPLSFLQNPTIEISHWDAINIHSQLRKMHSENLPDFSKWLNHNNDSVIFFCLKMIQRFRQIKAEKAINDLLEKTENKHFIAIILRITAELQLTSLEKTILSKIENSKLFDQSLLTQALEVIHIITAEKDLKNLITEKLQNYPVEIRKAVRFSLYLTNLENKVYHLTA